MAYKKIGEILVARGLISAEQLKEALAVQAVTKEYLGALLIRKKFVTEADLLKALSEQFNIPLVSLSKEKIDWDLSIQYFAKVSAEGKALPIFQDEFNVIVAVRDPLDKISLSNIEESIRPKRLRLVLVTEA
jgi:type IV pilus assembly protein PilB